MDFLFNVTENMTNTFEVLNVANSFVDGMMGLGIIIVVFFGTLFLTSMFSARESFVASSFVTMVMSMFLKFMGLLNDFVLWFFGVLFIGTLIWAISTKTPGVGA